jgi:hypothetical protein
MSDEIHKAAKSEELLDRDVLSGRIHARSAAQKPQTRAKSKLLLCRLSLRRHRFQGNHGQDALFVIHATSGVRKMGFTEPQPQSEFQLYIEETLLYKGKKTQHFKRNLISTRLSYDG